MSDLTALFRVEPSERRARLRSLRMAARILCGPRARDLEMALADAERDDAAVRLALRRLDELPPLDRRRVLSSWGRTLS